jgi:hypothetical protein
MYQGTTNQKYLNCRYCNKGTALKKGLYSRVVKVVNDGRVAAQIIMKLNEESCRTKEKI